MRIAFLDHHLNNYHANVFLAILRNELASENIEVSAAFELRVTDDDWCAKSDIYRALSVEDAMSRADAAIILAPDDIHAHPELCERAIPAGKPLFIDKLLANSVVESQAILKQAKSHGVTFLASSALRHSIELEEALASLPGQPDLAVVRGYGDWQRYGVHTVAMALRSMGPGPRRIINTGLAGAEIVTLEYEDGRKASIQVFNGDKPSQAFPWTFALRFSDAFVSGQVIAYQDFYVNQLRAACRMFQSGVSSMAPEEALDTVAVLETATTSRLRAGEWLDIATGR